MFPYNYINEILAIARKNHKSWDVGLNMFINNCKDAYAENDPYVYHGADELDYKKIHDTEIAAEIRENGPAWEPILNNEFMKVYRANHAEIVRLHQAGDKAGLKKFMIEAAEKMASTPELL